MQNSVCFASAFMAALPRARPIPLCFREYRHDDKRGTCQNDSGRTVLWSASGREVHRGFVYDIRRKQEKADANESESRLLAGRAPIFIGVEGHSPKKDETGGDLDEAVDSESEQGNTSRKCACSQCHETSIVFQPIVKYSRLGARVASALRSTINASLTRLATFEKRSLSVAAFIRHPLSPGFFE